MKSQKLTKSGRLAISAPFRWITVSMLIFFIALGQTDFVRAWIYAGVYISGALIHSFILLTRMPELIDARGKVQKGSKKWDTILVTVYFLFAMIIVPLTAGLDLRFTSFSLSVPSLYAGIALYVISLFFSIWPMLHNPFFEGTVRIQEERGHRVVSSGPYNYIRHPGYISMAIGALPMPLAVGSVYALIPALTMIILVIIRTYLEDKTLQNELAGYSEYCKKVRFRLIPYIW